jgi:predicted DNA-binding protein
MIHPRLHLNELASKESYPEKLLSIRLPVELLNRLDDLGRRLRARKAEVVLALLNEGLARVENQIRSRKTSTSVGKASGGNSALE